MGTLFYTVIFNARAHDAKRCLFIHNVAEVISASKQSLRSPIISPVPPPMSTFAYLVQIAKNLYFSETRRRLVDRFHKQLRQEQKGMTDAFKLVPRHFHLPSHVEQHIAVFGLSLHLGSLESRKTLE